MEEEMCFSNEHKKEQLQRANSKREAAQNSKYQPKQKKLIPKKATSKKKKTFFNLLAKWSKKVKDRFLNTCAKCGKRNNIESHHIISIGSCISLALEPKNGIAFCIDCHRLSSEFSAHLTPELFLEWLEENYPGLLTELKEKKRLSLVKMEYRKAEKKSLK